MSPEQAAEVRKLLDEVESIMKQLPAAIDRELAARTK
jgi:hypothetical protein